MDVAEIRPEVQIEDILQHWSGKSIPSWELDGKISAPRICLAKLVKGMDVEDVNTYLIQCEPWSKPGTSWFFHQGDYDFSLVPLTAIFYLFKEDENILFPDTRKHLLDNLLTLSGRKGSLRAPNTLGLVKETENHILMMEGSRYLKNQYLLEHGGIDEAIVIEHSAWLARFIEGKRKAGLEEFNSRPYSGYTLTALLNLGGFGKGRVKEIATGLLDDLNRAYAYSNMGFRRYPPFNRHTDYSSETNLEDGPHSSMMKVWSFGAGIVDISPVRSNLHHSLMASAIPYSLPEDISKIMDDGLNDTFLMSGHGKSSSPEIYSRGPGFLISAGGVRPRLLSSVVVRPTTLFLDDGASDLMDVIHMEGPGERWSFWNNTGVWKRFAVTRGPVHIPEGWKPVRKKRGWILLERSGVKIMIHSSKDLGILNIPPDGTKDECLDGIISKNPDPGKLHHRFITLEGDVIEYDLRAGRRKMVIESVNGKKMIRDPSKVPYRTQP